MNTSNAVPMLKNMPTNRDQVPAKPLRTASFFILAFGLALVCFGWAMFSSGSSDGDNARLLQAEGLSGTVVEARAGVVRAADGELHTTKIELTVADDAGNDHVFETNNFPRYNPPVNSEEGWVEDFPTKTQIVGQRVRYLDGEKKLAELEGELPELLASRWSFPNYLGLALMIMGGCALIGAIITWTRASKRMKNGV